MVDEQNESAELETAKESDEGGENSSPKKKPFYKNVMLLGIMGGSIVAIGAGLFFTKSMWMPIFVKSSEEEKPTKKELQPSKALYFELANIVVNLRQTQKNKKPVYFKLSVMIEVEAQNELDALNAIKPRIIDQFQVYLRELTVEDLSASEGGLQRLREELLIRINGVTKPLVVKDMLFKDVLIQ
jgi:flagellar FliL protein